MSSHDLSTTLPELELSDAVRQRIRQRLHLAPEAPLWLVPSPLCRDEVIAVTQNAHQKFIYAGRLPRQELTRLIDEEVVRA